MGSPGGGGSGSGTWATCPVRVAAAAGSFPSVHPDPHRDVLRPELLAELDDRMIPVPVDVRVHLLHLDLEEGLERFPDLGLRRGPPNDELEAVSVRLLQGGCSLEEVQGLLRHVRMQEDLVRVHGHAAHPRRASSALSVNIVRRPGSPPGARTSAFRPAGLTTSTPGRFRNARDTPSNFIVTTRIDRGVRYFRPRSFPRPARMWVPADARSTSAYTPRARRIWTPFATVRSAAFSSSSAFSTTMGRVRSDSNRWPRPETVSGRWLAARAEFRAFIRSLWLIFMDQIAHGFGPWPLRPPTVPGAWAPIIVPRILGARETPWPLPDHRTE